MKIFSQKNSKKMTAILIGVFLFVQVFGMAWPSPSKAQFGQEAAAIISWAAIQESLEAAAMGGLISSVSYFMRKLAYDSARWIASGGSGQGALAFQDGFGSYLAQTAGDSVATAVEDFGKPFGLNLCQLPDINLRVGLQIGFRRLYDTGGGAGGGPKPSCTFQKLKNGWSPEAFENQFGAGGSKFISETFSNAISIKEGDFGIALTGMAAVDRITTGKKTTDILGRNEGSGFKPLIDLISGRIKTPSGLIKEEATALTAKNQAAASQNQISGIYGSKLKAVLPMAANVFLNTLTGELLNKAKRGLFDLIGGGTGADGGFVDTTSYYSQGVVGNKKLADKAFSFFFSAVPTKQLSSYYNDLISQFASCPLNHNINNCVIDTGLQTALEEARNGRPLTIIEAMSEKNNFLHRDWPLISPRRPEDNTNKDCYSDNKYCYSNIQKLRKARILPLGFEIAAFKADPDNLNDWTLQKVVDGFDVTSSPYYHLIDPNWIIRMPDVRCEAEVYGELMSDYSQGLRQRECADLSSCILEGENGECLGQYGYCLTEKNVWQLGGTSCPAQYNTCNTFIARDGQTDSYLARSVDYGECNVDNIGCLSYSTELNSDQWVNSASADISLKINQGRNQTIYFNDKIKSLTCSANDDGCTAFNLAVKDRAGQYGPSRQAPINLKKAPDYLQCYDSTPDDPFINWPQTKTDLNKIVKNEKCNSFASVCLPEEVGCEAYTPVSNGGPTVPAVVGGNSCPSVCVGYDVFKQEKSNFETSTYPLYFIPTEAQTCNASNVGCSEFTNLDEVDKGGEGKEYYSDLRYCERPTGDNEGTYYSWEGSASEGYVLRVHKMMKISQTEYNYILSVNPVIVSEANSSINSFFEVGSPAYVDDDRSVLELNVSICNAQNYNNLINNQPGGSNPDCRALYDKNGKVFYRLYQQTATVSEACHPLRKTEANLYVDSTITNSQICTSTKNGLWNSSNNSCQRCYKGGRYEDGNCVYWAISGAGESTTCSATANGCRAYTGTTAGNVQEVFFAGFEEATGTEYSLWNPKTDGKISISPESIQVGLHSLKVEGTNVTARLFVTGTLQNGDWYELSFWAKGQDNKKISMRLWQSSSRDSSFSVIPGIGGGSSLSLGTDWREYKLGPAQFTGDGDRPAYLIFSNSGSLNTPYFIDNVRLTRVQDSLYLIKNSWKRNYGDGVVRNVPLVCDSNQRDTFPGEALGCEAYTNSVGSNVYATGFDRLCRGEAVGCTAMYDTHNTLAGENADKEQAYNVYCQEGIGATNERTKCSKTIGGLTYECNMEKELGGCNIIGPVIISNGVSIDNTTREVLASGQISVPKNLSSIHKIQAKIVDVRSVVSDMKDSLGLRDEDISKLYRDFIAKKLADIKLHAHSIVEYANSELSGQNVYIQAEYHLIASVNEIKSLALSLRMDDAEVRRDFPSLAGYVSSTLINMGLIEENVLNNVNINSFQDIVDLSRGVGQQTVKEYINRLVGLSLGGTERGATGLIRSNYLSVVYPYDQNLSLLKTQISSANSLFAEFEDLIVSANFSADGIDTINSIWTELRSLVSVADSIIYSDCTGANLIVKNASLLSSVSGVSLNLDSISESLLSSNIADSLFIVPSTVIIPADTASSTPLFLTNRSEFSCSANSRGCQKLGQETQVLSENSQVAYNHSESMLYNNPDNYSSTLCRSDLVGCEEYKAGNTISYFKDPSLVGNKYCYYKEPAVGQVGGWYKSGLGKCGDAQQNLCKDKNDCNAGVECEKVGKLPCYENYLAGKDGYGLWSNGADNYGGWVGQCSSEFDQCKELIDHSNKTETDFPNGKPYYVIFDSLITNKNEECEGKVSQKEGCVLFDKTEDPQKSFSSIETYKASENMSGKYKYGQVSPVSTLTNDSNLILKVNRNRTCNTWLYCGTWDNQKDATGNDVRICHNYAVCESTNPGIEGCIKPRKTILSVGDGISAPDSRLTKDFYVDREVSWNSIEYSGMSMFNKYSVANLEEFKSDTNSNRYLGFKIIDDKCLNATNGKACGFDGNTFGKCFNNDCVYPVQNNPLKNDAVERSVSTLNEMAASSGLIEVSCKSYPEVDSPVSADLIDVGGFVSSTFPNVLTRKIIQDVKEPFSVNTNICQDGNKCSCSYKRYLYADGREDFWPFRADALASISTGICVGGKDGESCSYDSDCTTSGSAGSSGVGIPSSNGVCSPLRSKKSTAGMFGFCLELDISRPLPGFDPKNPQYPCLTWFPSDTSVSDLDIRNNYPEAGYYPNPDYDAVTADGKVYGQVYCTNASGNGETLADKDLYLKDEKISYSDPNSNDGILYNKNALISKRKDIYAIRFDDEAYTKQGMSDFGFTYEIPDHNDCEYPAKLWPFYALNFRPVLSGDTDFVKKMYSWVLDWAQYSSPEDNANKNSSICPDLTYKNKNSLILYVRSPSSFLKYQDEESVRYLWRYDDPIFNPSSYKIDVSKQTLFDEDIKNIRFAPFIFHDIGYCNESELQAIKSQCSLISSDVSIDFDGLRKGKPTGTNIPVIKNYSLKDFDFIEDSDIVREVYTSRGKIVKGSGTPKATEDIIRYVILVPMVQAAGADMVSYINQIYSENPDNVVTPQYGIGRSVLIIDFDFKTGKLISKLPFIWNWSDDIQGIISMSMESSAYWYYYYGLIVAPDLAAVVNLNPRCTEYSLVNKENIAKPEDETNKAWTNRVWSGAAKLLPFARNDIFYSLGQLNVLVDNYMASLNNTAGFDTLFENLLEDQSGININRDYYISQVNTLKNEIETIIINIKNNLTEIKSYLADQNMMVLPSDNIKNYIGNLINENESYNNQIRDLINNGNDDSVALFVTEDGVDYVYYDYYDSNYIYRQDNKIEVSRDFVTGLRHHLYNAKKITHSTSLPYFGSAQLSYEQLRENNNRWWPYNFTEEGKLIQGVPYACSSDLFNSTSFISVGDINTVTCQNLPLDNDPGDSLSMAIKKNASGVDALKYLFAKVYAGGLSIGEDDKKIVQENDIQIYTIGDDFKGLLPPQIYSLNPIACFDNLPQTSCIAGDWNNMTVVGENGQVRNGTLVDYDSNNNTVNEDKDYDGQSDELIGYNAFKVDLDFFAMADDNTMPIRRVRIDWRDQTSVFNKDYWGKYKNHKPYCESSNTITSPTVGRCAKKVNSNKYNFIAGMTCKSDADCKTLKIGAGDMKCLVGATGRSTSNLDGNLSEYVGPAFGDAPRACEETYFSISHVYYCTAELARSDWVEILSTKTVERLLLNGVQSNSQVCIFQPRVQIIDNWGYCNLGANEEAIQTIQYSSNMNLNCNETDPNRWTTYKGKIVVVNTQ